MRVLKKRLVKQKLLHEGTLSDDRYYHHQVLQYLNLKEEWTPGTSGKDARTTKKGWQRARTGSVKDYTHGVSRCRA